MKNPKRYVVPYRRKREGKTDYRKRLHLLLARKPRLVIRKSNSNILVQLVEFSPTGDKVIVSSHSHELSKKGWKSGLKSIPAAYLTGLLLGKKAKAKNITSAVLDTGLQSSTKGSRIYAALKGVIDQGIDIPHKEEILPSEERIMGTHVETYAKQLKEKNVEQYNKVFSAMLKNNTDPTALVSHVTLLKKTIQE